MQLTRRHLLAATLASLTQCAYPRVFGDPAAEPRPGAEDWKEVGAAAANFVRQESPSGCWPFVPFPSGAQAVSGRTVFSHYFLPLPISIDNKPDDVDYYESQYLQPRGEHDKFLKVGGYLRERPRGAGPWPSRFWKEINFGIDVLRACEIGIDAFGVDLLSIGQGRFWDDALRLYDTAQQVASHFRMVPEPDILGTSPVSSRDLQTALSVLGAHPSAFRLEDGRFIVAPFAPERRPLMFWADVLDGLAADHLPAAFVPVLLDAKANASKFGPISFGISEWGTRDVSDEKADNNASVWLAQGKSWMAPVSPQDARPKSSIFWEAGNTSLFRDMWERAINEKAPYVQLITWNDYGESTEVSPSSQTQFLFFDLTAYYISWYKSDKVPEILFDAVYYCHRREILGDSKVLPAGGMPLKLLGKDEVKNEVEMIAMLTSSATLEIQIEQEKWSGTMGAGMQILHAPARIGRPIFRIIRNSQVVVECRGKWEIRTSPDWQDALYVGGSSTRS